LDSSEKIFGNLEDKPFSINRWFKKNIIGILGTLIFHIFILILFLLIKIQSFREIRDLGITLDFSSSEVREEMLPEKTSRLTPGEIAFLEKLMSQQSSASNQASNVSENLEKELSTMNYVNKVEQELNQSRSEEWKKQQEELKAKILNEDQIPEERVQSKENETVNFKGLTNITYEFLEPPVNRYKIYLPVPVYKCRGEGTVLTDIIVDQTGKVISSKAFVQQDFPDKDCMIEVAEKYALLTQFEGNLSAPREQKARIIYKFIAQ
jgi:hypothetical protein